VVVVNYEDLTGLENKNFIVIGPTDTSNENGNQIFVVRNKTTDKVTLHAGSNIKNRMTGYRNSSKTNQLRNIRPKSKTGIKGINYDSNRNKWSVAINNRFECYTNDFKAACDYLNIPYKSNGYTKLIDKIIKKEKEKRKLITQINRIKKTINGPADRGVSYDSKRNKWQAGLRFQGKRIFLGRFETKQEAIEARLAAEEKYFKPILEKYEKEHPNE
jgi:hypothetical protein